MESVRVTQGNSVFRIKSSLYHKFEDLPRINNDAPICEIIQVINQSIFILFNHLVWVTSPTPISPTVHFTNNTPHDVLSRN